MKKTVLFVLLDQYADWEGAYLSSWLLTLGRENFEVKTVSLSKEPIRSIGGYTVLPDYDLDSVPADYEAVILIGGMSWRSEGARRVEPLVQRAFRAGKVLGGICDASAFLGTIGVLNHVSHTSNDLDDLKQWAKAAYTGEEHYLRQQAVCDHRVITANGTAALEFAREVMLTLEAAPADQIQGWFDFHKLGRYGVSMPGW